MASGWNLWVWLQCIVGLVGVVVRRYIDIRINFPYSTCISSFFLQPDITERTSQRNIVNKALE